MPSFAKSYTQWGVYKNCPSQYKYRYIEKMTTPKGDSAVRGTSIHSMVEDLVSGKADTFPRPDDGMEGSGLLYNERLMKQYEEFFVGLREYKAEAEVGFSLDHNWEMVSPVIWVRGFMDIVVPQPDENTVHVFELKSGKVWDDHIEQRHFYGLAAMGKYPWAEKIIVQGIYLDLGKNSDPMTYPVTMKATYKYMWNSKLEQIDNPNSYVPHPGNHCGWCPFARDKGGPCKFGSHREA